MPDSSVAVTPSGSTLIDNSQVVTDAGTVMRQRVEDIETMMVLRKLTDALERLSMSFGPDGRLMVRLTDQGGAAQAVTATVGTVTAVTAVTTVGTVTALANLAPTGVTNPAQFLLNQAALLQRGYGIA